MANQAQLFQVPAGKATAVSLTLPRNLSHGKWIEVGRTLGRLQGATLWFIGDWWAFGEYRYGKRKALVEADDWQGPEFQTCANAATICRAFETSRRREVLGFKHHAEVAALSARSADALLDWCEAGIAETGKPRSIRELRAERDRRAESAMRRMEIIPDPLVATATEVTLAVRVTEATLSVRTSDYHTRPEPDKPPSAEVVVIEGGRSDDNPPTKDETMHARWQVSDDADGTRLHVSLWNGCGLTLVAPNDGSAPWVRLSSEAGDFELDQTSRQAFRRWLDAAQGRGTSR